MKRLVYIVTAPISARQLLRGQLAHMCSLGWDVHLVCAPGRDAELAATREGVTLHQVPLAREIAPRQDLKSLGSLVRLMHRLQPDVVNVSTPKAGLLGGLAAWICRVPRRVYVVRGLRYQGATGRSELILRAIERLTAAMATDVVAVSPSIAARLATDHITSRSEVIGSGSSNGVDAARLWDEATAPVPQVLTAVRHQHPGRQVVVFVGRMVRDKGIAELAEAVAKGAGRHHLVTVGPEEEELPTILARLRDAGLWHSVGYTNPVAPWIAAADVLALPSYREGFPNVVLEAAAVGVPAVVAAVDGSIDTIQEGITGRAVPVKDPDALLAALDELRDAPTARRAMGLRARERAVLEFSQERIWNGLDAIYRR